MDTAPNALWPTADKLYWRTLQALRQLGGSATVQEINGKVIELAGFSEAQQGVPHKGGPTSEIAYRLAWARTHLRLAGAVEPTVSSSAES